MFTDKDLAQLESHGTDLHAITLQLESFRQGFPFLNIDRAAVAGDGILRLNAQQQQVCRDRFREARSRLDIVKFVPASGAATRMFKDLFPFLEDGKQTEAVQEVTGNIDRFAFGPLLRQAAAGAADPRSLISAMLSAQGLGYGASPKALILFHRYADGNRTALEEHLCEGALYAAGRDGRVNIHFTVSPEHQAAFEALVRDTLPRYEARYGVRYQVSYSCQKPSTDTLAVGPDNEPFREADGSLLLRPAGHGALLENLGEIDADVIFIKNIDNVTTDERKADTVHYKEVLAGQLLALQQTCFDHLRQLEEGTADEKTLDGIVRFVENDLSGRYSIAENAAVAEYGEKFDLSRYVDPKTGFISEKSKNGRPLRALELPGLWNGSMARWNTVFVEVPGTVFTPVKTVNDLLRAEHQPQA